MMELASRPYISTAPLSTHAALAGSHNVLAASSLPLPRPLYPPPLQPSTSSYSRRSSESFNFGQGAHYRNIPPLTHARSDSLRDRRSAPPSMTTADPAPLCSYNGQQALSPRHGYRNSEEGLGNTVPETCQHSSARSPSSRRNSVYSAQAQSDAPPPSKKRRSSSARGASMIVPPSINNSKQSLAEFAAQVTCLFWFEPTTLLNSIEEATTPPVPTQPLAPPSNPPPPFLKWVSAVLSTTQVSQNVVLLALLFVHRLKKLNPSVQGMPGSQYRLFTVALMLGNKYLDDNTYTNKTWAEVSGISVQEIHIMEVEFLSNMRYSLYVADDEWAEWHKKLGRFWAYWSAASELPPHPPVPKCTIPAPLPSPPYSNASSPPYTTSRTPPMPAPQSLPPIPQLPLPPLAVDLPYNPSSLVPQPDIFSRKRSVDSNAMQPPNKRIAKSQAPKLSVTVPQFSPSLGALGNGGYRFASEMLPLPATSQMPPGQTAPRSPVDSLLQCHVQALQPQLQNQYQPQLALPPCRSTPISFSPITTTPSSAGPQQAFTPFQWSSPYTARPTSPYSAHHSVANSPITPGHVTQYSPTSILGDRQSPYRPVRGVNTLLVPPHPHHLEAPQQLSYHQMHYQPLAKAREYRTGVVPYTHQEIGLPYL